MDEELLDQHQHSDNVYMANEKLVCSDCHKEEDKGLNECFCKCHSALHKMCPGCVRMHIPAGH